MPSNHSVIRAKTGNYSGTPCRMVSPNNCEFPKNSPVTILSEGPRARAKNLFPLLDMTLEAI